MTSEQKGGVKRNPKFTDVIYGSPQVIKQL